MCCSVHYVYIGEIQRAKQRESQNGGFSHAFAHSTRSDHKRRYVNAHTNGDREMCDVIVCSATYRAMHTAISVFGVSVKLCDYRGVYVAHVKK